MQDKGRLRLFNNFAAPELRALIGSLGLLRGQRVLDAGCGTGAALAWLAAGVAPDGLVLGLDLAAGYTRIAHAAAPAGSGVLQADLSHIPLRPGSFDLVWSVNTINHLCDPRAGVQSMAALLRPGGRIALGQSRLLPEMLFAWDMRLEREVNEAVRRYYREERGLSEYDLAWNRALLGLLRSAGLSKVTVHSILIERISPLDPAAEAYLREVILRDTWGDWLRPYLAADDAAELEQLCDPDSPRFCLRRPDFHYLQSFTLVTGEL